MKTKLHTKSHTSFSELPKIFLLSILFFFGLSSLSYGQTFTDNTPTTTGSWTVPAGVTSITVEVWGAGGAGGGSTSNNDGGSGGGGGAYVLRAYTVTPSQVISYTIGAGGTGSTANGTSGGASTIFLLTANGGAGGLSNSGAGGLGGTGTGGTSIISGSSGGAGGGNTGGNGGAGANGGAGGAGVNNGNGIAGTSPGGGGGGGERSGGSNRSGGNGGNGQITITWAVAAPSNDLCANPIALSVGTSCTFATYTNVGATDSGELPSPSCSSYGGEDVWFSVLVPASGEIIIDSDEGGLTDGAMQVYTGTCGSLSLLECDDDDSANGLMPYVSLTGQTPGATLLIRYFDYLGNDTGTFDLCAWDPNPVVPCTGTPSAGTITVTPTSGNPGSTYDVTGTGYTTGASNITYQWQYSDTGGTPWTNQGSATTTYAALTGMVAPTLGVVRTWRLVVTCTTSASSASSTTGTFTSATTYCTPTSSFTSDYISNFSTTGGITNISNPSGGLSGTGYGDFYSTFSASQFAGSSLNFSESYVGGSHGFSIWVDFNNNGVFETSERLYNAGSIATGFTGSITIPGGTAAGDYRMRIRAWWNNLDPDPCTNISYGEAEDYQLTVLASTPCTTPAAQPSSLTFSGVTTTQIDGSFTAASPVPDNYLVVMNTTNTTPAPLDGTTYNPGDTIGAGNTVVDNDANTTFSATSLTDSTTYYFFIFSYNNTACSGGPLYNTTTPLTNSQATVTPLPCVAPIDQPTALVFGTITSGTIDGSFTAASSAPDSYLVVRNTTNVAPTPFNGTTYNVGDTFGAGNTVVDNDTNTTFTATGLSETTTYYFFIFAVNNIDCTGGPAYNTAAPLTGSAATIATTYCIPSSSNSNNYIDDFSTTGGSTNITNNSSGYSTGGYGDFTAMVVTQTAGNTVNFSSNFIGNGTGDFGANIWIDYNNNSDFTDLGEQVFTSGGYVTNIAGSFTIPGATPAGSYRMRIVIDYFSANPDSCTISSRGEAEDYTLVVGTPLPCTTPSNQPTGLTFNSITSSTISGSFIAATSAPDNYLIVINTTGVTPTPSNGTFYNIGDTLGAGNTIIDNDNDLVFSASGLSPTTTYHFFIFSYNNLTCSGGPIYNVVLPETDSTTTTAISAYCTALSTSDESALYINHIEFIGALVNVSNLSSGFSTAPGSEGYQDFTGLTNSVQAQGEGFNVFIEGAVRRGRIKAWIDWNLDGSFNNTNELVYDTGSIGTISTTFGIIIPSDQAIGDYRLRIRMYNTISDAYFYDYTSCENFDILSGDTEYGETEDYTFTVVESCSATIDSITEGENCGEGTVLLNVTGSPGTVEYNWYANDTDLVPIATTASGAWITPNIAATTSFFVTASNGSCESLVKTEVIATINTVTTLTFTPSVPEVCGEDQVIEITATGENEIQYLIKEDFESGGLGVFTNNHLITNADNNAFTAWQNHESTYIPTNLVWYPAISSGFETNNFVMATSDTSPSGGIHNALESLSVDTSTFTDLTLTFDMYFSRYFFNLTFLEEVHVEVSTDGGTNWTTEATYDDDIGYGTDMASLTFNLDAYINETDLKVRIRYETDGWYDGVAVDNINLYGNRPLTSSFTWTSDTSIDAFTDVALTTPYTPGTAVNTVYVRPTQAQLELNTFSFVATATLTNGCDVSVDIEINNRTKYWVGGSSTDWNDGTNWLPTGVPTADNCVIIPNQTIISGTNYEAYARNLIVRPTGDLEIESNNTLTVTEWVDVETNGTFDIRDSASLVQVDNVANSGTVRVDRDTNPMYRYDYTYWSSPVDVSYTLNDLSPNTLFDKYFSWIPSVSSGHGEWQTETSSTTGMVTAKGYVVRAPQSYSTNPSTTSIYTATFTGTPNNGDISIPIQIGTDATLGDTPIGDTAVTADDDQWNLIGNPYPSAIDIFSFLEYPGNDTLLDGTAYVWTHNTPIDGSLPDPFYADYSLNYTSNDYASVNSFGGTSTTAANSGGSAPTGNIASGQGFFVLGEANGTAVFNNTMRVRNLNNDFFRNNNTNNSNSPYTNYEKHRFWLNLSNENGAFSQIVLGYAEGATLGWDRGIDALSFGGNNVTFYSLAQNLKLKMQGKPLPFETSDIIPLGYKATVQDSYRIGIDHLDPLFVNQSIYLKDKELNIVHDLKTSPYIFSTNIGSFDDRFEIIYNNNTLSTNEYNVDTNDIKVISNLNLEVISQSKTIKKVEVYNILGKKLMTYNNIDSKTILLKGLLKSNNALLLKITFSDNSQLYKKVLY